MGPVLKRIDGAGRCGVEPYGGQTTLIIAIAGCPLVYVRLSLTQERKNKDQ